MISEQRPPEEKLQQTTEAQIVRPTLRTVFFQDGRMCIERTDGDSVTLSRTGRVIKHRADRSKRSETIAK
jgi:hypothetical protein